MVATCCHKTALDQTAAWCNECGKPLLRCQAHGECGGLLDSSGTCPVCVAPELTLDPEGVHQAKVGSALSIPLVLSNTAQIGRPLFVNGLWTREGGGDWRRVEVPWERLDAGSSAPLNVRADALDKAGVHQLEIVLALATRWRWREEVAAFTTSLALTIEQEESLTVQQNITYAADAPQTGATIYAPMRVQFGGSDHDDGSCSEPHALPLTRATKIEREFGLRGYEDGTQVSRAASLCWRGFRPDEIPADTPVVSADGMLILGRSRSKQRGGPNDVRLLVHDDAGAINEPSSRAVSRQHLGLCIENGRLVLRVESDRGAWVNGRSVPRGTSVSLRDGDRFSPIARGLGRLAVTASFEANHGVVEAVTFTRT